MRLAGSVAVVAPTGGELTATVVAALRAAGAVVADVEGDDAEGAIRAARGAHGRVDTIVVTDVALAAPWLQASAPVLAAGGGGAITVVVTSRALAGDVRGWREAADGGAAIALTTAIATAHGKAGVRVNAIAIPPGDLEAEVVRRSTLLPRAFDPADLAALVVFLSSSDAAFVTGQCLRCDGGLLAHLPHYAALVESGTTTTGS